jgi:hypothetical protein
METSLTPEEIEQLKKDIITSLRKFKYKGINYNISKSSFLDKIMDKGGDILPGFEYIDDGIAFYCDDEDFDLPARKFRKMLLKATEWE